MPSARVALARGDDRAGNVLRALDLLGPLPSVAERRSIVVKPNFVSVRNQLAATHVDAVRATLTWLRQQGAGHVIVAEGPAMTNAASGFRRYGYEALAREFDVEFRDLNQDQGVPVEIYDRHLRPFIIHLARTIVESDLRVSVTPLKTHDSVIVTASLKNVLMGSPLNKAACCTGFLAEMGDAVRQAIPRRFRSVQNLEGYIPGLAQKVYHSEKVRVHQGFVAINLNLFLMARVLLPHLAVIDAFRAMEGNGPTSGDPVDLRVAIASGDSVAADSVGATMMGFDPWEIGYLSYCARAGLGVADLSQIEVLGEPLEACARPFVPPPHYDAQRRWPSPAAEAILQRYLPHRLSAAS